MQDEVYKVAYCCGVFAFILGLGMIVQNGTVYAQDANVPSVEGLPVPTAIDGTDNANRPGLKQQRAQMKDKMQEFKQNQHDFRQNVRDNRAEFKADAQAQHQEFRDEAKQQHQDFRAEAASRHQEFKQNVRENKEELLEQFDGDKEALKAHLMEEREAMKSELQAKRDSFRADFEAKRDERKANLQEKRQALRDEAKNRAGARIERLVNRMQTAIDRFAQIALRVESRIDTLEEDGVDVGGARDALADAQAEIDDLRNDAEFVMTVADDVFSSENPRERIQEIRDAIAVVKEGMKTVQQALRDAVSEIKANAGDAANDEGGDDSTDE